MSIEYKNSLKQGENFIKPGDREKASKTWSLLAEPRELTGLVHDTGFKANLAKINQNPKILLQNKEIKRLARHS